MIAKINIDIFLYIGLSLICLGAGLACRGDGVGLAGSGDLLGASGFAAQIQPIFDTNCIRCHAPGGIGFIQTGGSQNNGLDLTSGNSHGKLVNQRTFEAPNVAPKWRVLPGEPDSSYIIQKITSTSPKAGNRMPLDGPPFLSQNEIQLIRDWIADGAPNN
ncbi:MAG: hypothetical protein ACE5HI_03270 [bacterium]